MSRKQAAAPRKVGIIIANTGTPEAPTRKAVKKYLSQFLMDPRICPMPRPVWWTLLHTTILRKRSRARRRSTRRSGPKKVRLSLPLRLPWSAA